MSGVVVPPEVFQAARAARKRAQAAGLGADRVERRVTEATQTAWISMIVARAMSLVNRENAPGTWVNRANAVIMLIQVKKANPNLNLEKLARANDADFLEDFCGISRYSKAPSGQLSDGFIPKCMDSES